MPRPLPRIVFAVCLTLVSACGDAILAPEEDALAPLLREEPTPKFKASFKGSESLKFFNVTP